jgi:hypothetical protein
MKERKDTIKEVGMTILENSYPVFYVSEVGVRECLYANADVLLVYQYFGETTASLDLDKIKFTDAGSKSLFERLNKIIDRSNDVLDKFELKELGR